MSQASISENNDSTQYIKFLDAVVLVICSSDLSITDIRLVSKIIKLLTLITLTVCSSRFKSSMQDRNGATLALNIFQEEEACQDF